MTWFIILSVFAAISLSPRLVVTIGSRGWEQAKLNGKVLQGGGVGQCPSTEERERVRNEINQFTESAIANITRSTLSYTCNGTPGWRRVAFINMTDTSYSCPTGLTLTSYSKRTCGRSHTNAGCSSTTFDVGDLPYSSVCGRIRGYQFGAAGAFYADGNSRRGIDSYYVDGVSLTYGGVGERQHIWTFASGATEMTGTGNIDEDCPCDTSRYYLVPNFVGNDYFCESGLNSAWIGQFIFHPSDVLWDGQNCIPSSTCCQLNNPPWFTKNLPSSTADNIEMRVCTDNGSQYDDIPLELIEIYVK